jgi:hypothetical protein
MTINEALKRKNKLVSEIDKQAVIAMKYNSMAADSVRRYSAKAAAEGMEKLTHELVELKTKIHLANAPVYSKIFEISELKNLIKKYRAISSDEGMVAHRWSDAPPTMMVVEMDVVTLDTKVSELEAKIETLQNELDVWNNTHHI